MAILLTRLATEQLYLTLKTKLSEDIGISSGSIYLQAPEHLYINDGTELTSGLEESRYPAISINPESTDFRKTKGHPAIQHNSYTATGEIEYWESDAELIQDLTFCVETTTKRDHRRYWQLMWAFFNINDTGIVVRNDVLPEKPEYINLQVMNAYEDLEDAPYRSIFMAKAVYRIYKESLEYLFQQFQLAMDFTVDGISGNVVSITGDVSGTVSYIG